MESEDEPAPPRPRPKRVLVVLAGAFDPPGEKTPLSDAEKPALDRMARLGRGGMVQLSGRSPWDGFAELVGLAPETASLGAAEALGAGIEVGPDEAAYRADFVTLDGRGVHDPFGGKVKDPEGALLLDAVRAASGAKLFRVGGHRNVAVLPGPAVFLPSPWEMVDRKPGAFLPESGPIRALFDAAVSALAEHDVNAVRVDLGENPANALWLHGGGPAFAGRPEAAPPGGAVIVGRGAATAGVARALGWNSSLVEGDDEVLAAAALAAIATTDLVVVRTESVLDAAATGGFEGKRDALSLVDARLVAPLLSAVEERDAFVMAVAADSVIDVATRAPSRRAAPFAIAGTGRGAGDASFTERACDVGGLRLASGADLAALLLRA